MKKPNKTIVIFVSVLSIIAVLGWMGLTKVGAVPNFMNIEFLCPQQNMQDIVEDIPGGDVSNPTVLLKPVIYLYPQAKQDVAVRLDLLGKFKASYPQYDSYKGWQVTASPDGKIIDRVDGREYSYLFWEGDSSNRVNWDMSKGFVVKGLDTRDFLRSTLAGIGLTPKEYNEFIVYWYPLMKDNAYNLITFAGKQYTDTAPLTIEPKPDSILRVFMVYKPLNEKISVQPQTIQPFDRKGFTVIEWGGTETK